MRTDLCGVIGRDDKTIQEFSQFQQRQATLGQTSTAPFGSIGGAPSFNTIGGNTVPLTGSTDPLTGGSTSTTGGGLF